MIKNLYTGWVWDEDLKKPVFIDHSEYFRRDYGNIIYPTENECIIGHLQEITGGYDKMVNVIRRAIRSNLTGLDEDLNRRIFNNDEE